MKSKISKGVTIGIVGAAIVYGAVVGEAAIGSLFNPNLSALEATQSMVGIQQPAHPHPYASSVFAEFNAPEINLEELTAYYHNLGAIIDTYDQQLRTLGISPSTNISDNKYQKRIFS